MNSVEKFLSASKTNNLCITGTKIGEQAYLISYLSSPVFFIVGDGETAFKAEQQLLALNKKVAIIDNIDNPYMISKYQSQDNYIKLLNTLYLMANEVLDVVILTPQAINLKLGSLDKFKSNIIELATDKNINLDKFIQNLIACGYTKVDTVQQIGEFAIRGEVVDIFAPNHTHPIRINLFDDLIENIIYFDSVNLSTVSKLDKVDICPMVHTLLSQQQVDDYTHILSSMAERLKENKLYELLTKLEVDKRISN
ncbi:MAG: hypothetical protein IJA72_03120, partial [Clostridia bacterium]|nr:hypothetical protein [Clostridia bacterium]